MKHHPLLRKVIILSMCILCLLFSIGAIFGLYIYSLGIIEALNSNDKSLLFWYLPFLFGGLISGFVAIGTGFLVYMKIKPST